MISKNLCYGYTRGLLMTLAPSPSARPSNGRYTGRSYKEMPRGYIMSCASEGGFYFKPKATYGTPTRSNTLCVILKVSF
jgi:hypothetical protein